jgi:nucleoside-diphosphate-sugar epimerase
MKILITGGAGYLGSVLTPTLLALGHELTVVDNFLFRQNTLTDCCHYATFRVVRGDCRDEVLMKKLVPMADVIIPLAALVGAPLCDRDPVAAKTTNSEAVACNARTASASAWPRSSAYRHGCGLTYWSATLCIGLSTTGLW